ncbi:RasGEF domain-containing protein [Legionella parisiensis]|uniref:Ras-GEF domain-containing protein n=1 Tax=Legionella parisiensis TaxID=45071 RepID=A0A1E5JU18_9GAMM|nr:RasGEF domain-containing protein [Legionella parisiensis]KTD43091.1 RasGEF domain protein [Legionella parisiensis]OEH47970.1 hypothetical protein lpari_00994 [Legionella parisiensis]STX77830.1 RasGEF domain [Legionella parisiensis]
MSKNSFFKNLIEKQQILIRPNGAFEWDEMLADKETQKKIRRDPDRHIFFDYIESRFAYEHARFFDVVLRKANSSAEEYLEIRKALKHFIKENISKHSSQDAQMHAFFRWVDTAIMLRKRHNYEGYFLVRDTLMEMDINLKLTKNKAFKPHLKMYNQLVQVDATLIDEQLRADYSKIPLNDFANPDGFSKWSKASPNLKAFLENREYLETHLERDIMQVQGGARRKAFCRWIDIAINLREKHNYEGYFLVITNLRRIDGITEGKDFPKSYLKKYMQLLEHMDPSINFAKLRALWDKDHSPNKLKATFYWSKELTNLNERMEIAYNLEVQKSMLQEKNRKLAEIAKEQGVFADRTRSYSARILQYMEVKFVTVLQEYYDSLSEKATLAST